MYNIKELLLLFQKIDDNKIVTVNTMLRLYLSKINIHFEYENK